MRSWWPNRIPFRLRVFFRGAFLLLAVATVALALTMLQEEKRLSYRNYQDLFHKNVAQITARLQHPTGQLALLNPPDATGAHASRLSPLLLPFPAIDFDDKSKAQQAAEMAGCLIQYPDQARLCVAVGSSPMAGAFIYAIGHLNADALVDHVIGERDLGKAHRVRIQLNLRGQVYRWIAPLESPVAGREGIHGRLSGFVQDEQGRLANRPDRDFRGWMWQDARCASEHPGLASDQPTSGDARDCRRRVFYAVRIPVDALKDEVWQKGAAVVWPPKDLAQMGVQVQVLPPGSAEVLFDSAVEGAVRPFALSDLNAQLLVGESLRIRRLGQAGARDVFTVASSGDDQASSFRWLDHVIRRLAVEGYDQPLQAREVIVTPAGDFEVLVTGDVRGVNRTLGAVAMRLSWFVAAMLAAIMLTWLAIEVRIIRRITVLTRRAASVKKSVDASEGLIQLDLNDLRGGDELGLLAGVLSDLMQRINEDVKREQIRAAQEKDMWQAVGHEIMSPLQSLLALHGHEDDPSLRYINRMQQAVRVLYGTASPSEAIQSASLQVSSLDIQAFLSHVADNAVHAGIPNVVFDGVGEPVLVKADEYSLEDVVTHVLSNAQRHRLAGSAIRIQLLRQAATVEVRIHNQGPLIPVELIGKIFEYGFSQGPDGPDSGDEAKAHRGQGLFVARTYMAKMGGTIDAFNESDGVSFVLTLSSL